MNLGKEFAALLDKLQAKEITPERYHAEMQELASRWMDYVEEKKLTDKLAILTEEEYESLCSAWN